MPPPTDWTDKDQIIRQMRMEKPPKTWDEIAYAIGLTREVVRIRAKYHLTDCYKPVRQVLNR